MAEPDVATTSAGSQPSRRRWLLPATSALLIALLVAIGLPLWQAWQQRRALDRLSRMAEVEVLYDYQFDEEGTLQRHQQPSEPIWLRRLLGPHFFDRVAYVHFSAASDAGLALLPELAGLSRVSLERCPELPDSAFSHLRSVPGLEFLWAEAADLDDRDVKLLAGHPQLRKLFLSYTPVTDASSDTLAQLPPPGVATADRYVGH